MATHRPTLIITNKIKSMYEMAIIELNPRDDCETRCENAIAALFYMAQQRDNVNNNI